MNALRRYGAVQTETASKERLMVMLFEAALRHIQAGVQHLEAKQPLLAVGPLTKASDIVAELRGTLDAARAPELAASLSSVYLFVLDRLMRAATVKDAVAAREAERAFAPLVDAFRTAVAGLETR